MLNPEIGTKVEFQITGCTGRYSGTIIEINRDGSPIIKVDGEETGPYSRLKVGDYIITRPRSKE